MPNDKPYMENAGSWKAEFSKRLTDYQTLVDNHRELEKVFEAEKQVALDTLRIAWIEELRGPQQLLFEVAPIFAGDVDAIPTRRAAYSDRTAALMAKLANLTYVAFEDAEKKKILEDLLTQGRVKLVETLSVEETEVLVADTDKCVIVAFRGTSSKQDMRTDLQTRFNVQKSEIGGSSVSIPVHAGFHDAYNKVAKPLTDLLNELLEKSDKKTDKPIYLTGHSLGGALALVASAALAKESKLGDHIAAVYTFGAPRVGKHNFAEIVKAPHYRIVNGGDLVPLVPPTWLNGYRHTGTPILLMKNTNMPIRRSPWGTAALFASMSLLLWPFTRQLLFLKAHSCDLYVANLDRIARHRGKWT